MSTPPAADGASAAEPGKVYRSKRRPGLTALGVAVIGLAVSVVAALISVLVTDGLGWIYYVPFVAVSGYCAWEVRDESQRAALIMPPLAMLVITVLTPWVNGDSDSLRGGFLRAITLLTRMAPALVAAVALSGAILAWRRWGRDRSRRVRKEPSNGSDKASN